MYYSIHLVIISKRTNLMRLFATSHNPEKFRQWSKQEKNDELNMKGNDRIKMLIIDLISPRFLMKFSNDDRKMLFDPYYCENGNIDRYYIPERIVMGCEHEKLLTEFSGLNPGQKDAVKKVIGAKDYVLLLGMPGTGYTSMNHH
jgi:hypothetical protein